MRPNILADLTISKAMPLALRETVPKLLSLRKSILSCLHLSEFSLNLLSLDQRRTSCIVLEHRCTKLGNNFRDHGVVCEFPYGREGVTEVIDHNRKEPWANPASLWNSGGDWFKIRKTVRIKFDTLISVS